MYGAYFLLEVVQKFWLNLYEEEVSVSRQMLAESAITHCSYLTGASMNFVKHCNTLLYIRIQ
jgi:hypothetical protein